jgi:chromosome partitioning protein
MAVIGIAQQKGGAGKTTLAVQLGVAWLVRGKRVAMLDIDPQASLLAWFDLRRRRLGDEAGGLVVRGLSGWRLGSELRRLRDAFDHILVDSPPHAELVVCSTKQILVLAAAERTSTVLVLNRVPPRGRAAAMIRAEIEAAGWPLAVASLGNRQAFAASIGEGRGVAETAPASPAGHEIAALGAEILGRLG